MVPTESMSLRYLVTITRKILQATLRHHRQRPQQRITLSMKQKIPKIRSSASCGVTKKVRLG